MEVGTLALFVFPSYLVFHALKFRAVAVRDWGIQSATVELPTVSL